MYKKKAKIIKKSDRLCRDLVNHTKIILKINTLIKLRVSKTVKNINVCKINLDKMSSRLTGV